MKSHPTKCALALSLCLAAAGLFAETQPNQIVCAFKRLDAAEMESTTPFDFLATSFGNLVYSGLVNVDANAEFKPDLAERWAVSPDGLAWTFFLRKNLTFHDGTPLVASDVAAIYRKILDPASESPLGAIYRMVKSVSAEGTGSVRVMLAAPYGPLPYLMMRSIVPDRPVAAGSYPPGTGPFKFESMSKDEIVFAANPTYYAGRPKLDRVVFRMYPDQKKAWVALLRGEVDAVTDLELEDYTVIRNDKRFKTWELLDSFCYSLIFNTRDPLLSQPGIRRAVAAAIDRTDLIDRALEGAGVPANGPFLPGSLFSDPNPSLQAYDLPKAKKLLADLGWKDADNDWVLEKAGQELSIRILVDTGDTAKEAAAKRLQWQLLQAGIKAEFEYLPPQQLFGERLIPGKFQAVFMQTNTQGDPDQILNAFWHSASIGRSNLAGYRNSEIDRLIDQGRITSDTTLRRETYRNIHRILAEDAPAAFLFVKKRFSATSTRVGGVVTSLESFYSLSLKDWFILDTSTEGR
jgi:peptide/nickel transport system substrate-binding protein